MDAINEAAIDAAASQVRRARGVLKEALALMTATCQQRLVAERGYEAAREGVRVAEHALQIAAIGLCDTAAEENLT